MFFTKSFDHVVAMTYYLFTCFILRVLRSIRKVRQELIYGKGAGVRVYTTF